MNDQNAGERKGIPIALDPDAKSADPGLPAFLARPEGAPVYHGFPVVEGVEVEGFRIGMITDFASSPDEGDAYVIAPDGSRGGLVWSVGDQHEIQEVCVMDRQRWDVWAVWLPEPMLANDAVRRNLTHIVPRLREKWLVWKERYR